MKKTFFSIVVVALVGAMIGGGIYAAFGDADASTGNTFTAGKLNLVPSTSGTGPGGKYTVTAGGDGINGKVVFANLAPGDSGAITWTLSNTPGSVASILNIASSFTYSDVDANEPEAGVAVPHANNAGTGMFAVAGDLDEFVGVKLQRGAGTDQASAIASFTYILGDADYYATLAEFEAALDAAGYAMESYGGNKLDTLVYRLTWNIASDIKGPGVNGKLGETTSNDDIAADDNIIQSDSVVIDITFTLTQS